MFIAGAIAVAGTREAIVQMREERLQLYNDAVGSWTATELQRFEQATGNYRPDEQPQNGKWVLAACPVGTAPCTADANVTVDFTAQRGANSKEVRKLAVFPNGIEQYSDDAKLRFRMAAGGLAVAAPLLSDEFLPSQPGVAVQSSLSMSWFSIPQPPASVNASDSLSIVEVPLTLAATKRHGACQGNSNCPACEGILHGGNLCTHFYKLNELCIAPTLLSSPSPTPQQTPTLLASGEWAWDLKEGAGCAVLPDDLLDHAQLDEANMPSVLLTPEDNPTLSPFSFAPVEVLRGTDPGARAVSVSATEGTLRSDKDPWVVALRATEGTFSFGVPGFIIDQVSSSLGWLGAGLAAVGIIFLVAFALQKRKELTGRPQSSPAAGGSQADVPIAHPVSPSSPGPSGMSPAAAGGSGGAPSYEMARLPDGPGTSKTEGIYVNPAPAPAPSQAPPSTGGNLYPVAGSDYRTPNYGSPIPMTTYGGPAAPAPAQVGYAYPPVGGTTAYPVYPVAPASQAAPSRPPGM